MNKETILKSATPELEEEVTHFASYLSTLKFSHIEDIVYFCDEYRKYQKTCPDDQLMLATRKYLLVLSTFGGSLIDYIHTLHTYMNALEGVLDEVEGKKNEQQSSSK